MALITIAELKIKHQKEVDEFNGLLFAFSKEQLKKSLAEKGLNIETDLDKILSMGSGCYILKDSVKEWKILIAKQKEELKQARKNKKDLKQAIINALNNYEYCYHHDDEVILNSLGISELNQEEKALYKKAVKEYISKIEG